MLADAVKMYLAIRRAAGFVLKCESFQLKSFAAFSEARGHQHVSSDLAMEWAGTVPSMAQRARRLGTIIRFARYMRAEDPRHQVPAPIFGAEKLPRRAPFILTMDQIRQIIDAAAHAGYRTLRRATYSTLFALLACTGLRVSEAIRLRFDDITADGLVIRRTKFRKSRLVPLHPTAQAGLERYLRQRRPYAPFDDHVFVSIRKKPLLPADVDTAFQTAVTRIGLPHGRGRVRPTPHSLRHAFAVRALQTCPDGRDAISRHMVALSTYLGHSQIANTYWYLEAVPDLMRDIADQSERMGMRGRS
jgi:integrase/recombinase XerD